MGKASRTKVDSSRREKVAAQRAAARRAEQRRRILIASGSIIAVLAIVVAFVVIKVNSKPAAATAGPNGPTGAALSSVIATTTSVPASVLDKVGDGGSAFTGKIQTIKPAGAALTANGKPEMLYMGAEYCPYCAAARWSMIVALSRFGTFSGLQTIHSAAANGAGNAEPDPNTPTWTFVNAKYTSPYLAFSTVELQTNIPDSSTGSYTNLQTPTSAQQALLTKYDAAPYTTEPGAIPFMDFGNKYVSIGSPYDPGVLAGLSWSTIASDLHNPSSPVAKAVNGTANYITAAICQMTGNQPASACTATVKSLEGSL
jgi:thiol-disulfide isomerase/thioredoxin